MLRATVQALIGFAAGIGATSAIGSAQSHASLAALIALQLGLGGWILLRTPAADRIEGFAAALENLIGGGSVCLLYASAMLMLPPPTSSNSTSFDNQTGNLTADGGAALAGAVAVENGTDDNLTAAFYNASAIPADAVGFQQAALAAALAAVVVPLCLIVHDSIVLPLSGARCNRQTLVHLAYAAALLPLHAARSLFGCTVASAVADAATHSARPQTLPLPLSVHC